ncbi:MAG TPA: hypothetical protein VK907_04630, partial [Phnomibacter sp.]|nr:hypothetical protein [Phnomibacter sp.]
PFPGAFTTLDGKMLKIYQSRIANDIAAPFEPDQWRTDRKKRLAIGCKDGWMECLEVQLQGKKRMMVEDFLRGYHFEETPEFL